MAKRKRVVRLFFNTFYEEVARRIIEEIERGYPGARGRRSSVLPEFYYVEVPVGQGDDVDEVARSVEELAKRLGGDRVFGVKAYGVET